MGEDATDKIRGAKGGGGQFTRVHFTTVIPFMNIAADLVKWR